MKLPSEVAEAWLASRFAATTSALVAAGATGVYAAPAPETAAEPFVTVQLVSAVAIGPIGRGVPTVGRLTYDVSAWDAGERTDRVFAIAAAVDAALRDQAPTTIAGGQVVHCINRGEVPAPRTVEGGQAYRRAGQLWEIMAEVSA